MTGHYGETHMGLHIGNSYRPATFDCMSGKDDKKDTHRGARVRALRKALDMNQEELAVLVEVDQSTVSDIERGAGFSAEVLMRLAGALRTTPVMVMQGRDDAVWPFQRVPMVKFLTLSTEDRAYVEGVLAKALDDISPDPTPEDLKSFARGHRASALRSSGRKRA
jgi:transcriptional regulator with XRE-family HTH domain